jgi:ankyrin repeat protein
MSATPSSRAPTSAPSRGRPIALAFLLLAALSRTTSLAAADEDLFSAAAAGDLVQVARLLATGADVNARNAQGATPLFWAAISGFRSAVKLLIANGADVNARDRNGFTALHVAAYQMHPNVAELLIREGAQVNARSRGGLTPIYKPLEALFELHAGGGPSPADVTAAVEVLRLLLANGARVDVTVNEEVTPLYAAVRTGVPKVVELLLANGADVNARTRSGLTPLMFASVDGDKDIVRLLLANGAHVNTKDNLGRTPLSFTVRTASIVMLAARSTQGGASQKGRGFIEPAKARIIQRDAAGMKKEWKEVTGLLLDHGASLPRGPEAVEPLLAAANLGYENLAEALIDSGVDVDDATHGETALHAAIAEKHRVVAELLIRRGANVNAHNMSQRTPLHFLARDIDDASLAKLMIAHGAVVNARDKHGATPLEMAMVAGNAEVAKVLKRHGGIRYIRVPPSR